VTAARVTAGPVTEVRVAAARVSGSRFRGPRRTAGILAVVLSIAGCAPAGLQNLDAVKHELREYERSGRYSAELAAVAEKAREYLLERTRWADASKQRLALVLDIDETALSNYPALRANDFGWVTAGPCALDERGAPRSPCGLRAWVELARAERIEPVYELYASARLRGVGIFFISGRPETLRDATERNLRSAGYTDWTELVLRPAEPAYPTLAAFKTAARERIEKAGWRVVVNVGDQVSDLTGGHGGRSFLLPNPFYANP
jgi:predicted secreted acid phosphatase